MISTLVQSFASVTAKQDGLNAQDDPARDADRAAPDARCALRNNAPIWLASDLDGALPPCRDR